MKTRRSLNAILVGFGYWGPKLARAFQRAGVAIRWVVETDPVRARLAGRALKAHTTDQLGVAARSDMTDTVIIATPPPTHASMVMEALTYDKHVFVEKPLAMTSGEAMEIEKLAAQRRRTVGVGHVYLYHRAFLMLQKKLHWQLMDKLEADELHLSLRRYNPAPHWEGASALWDLAPHEVSMAIALAGMPPTRVRVLTRTPRAAVFQMRFANGLRAQVDVAYTPHIRAREVRLILPNAVYTFDETREPVLTVSKAGQRDPRRHGAKDIELAYPPAVHSAVFVPRDFGSTPLEDEAQDFVSAIQFGREPRACVSHAHAVVNVLEAVEYGTDGPGELIPKMFTVGENLPPCPV